jgi:hypothetical protein
MKSLLTAILLTLLVVMVAACATTVGDTEPDPWGGISPTHAHHLAEGSRISVKQGDEHTVLVRVEEGRLWLNGRDLGAYDKSQPVHFLRDGRLTVAGETRARIGE